MRNTTLATYTRFAALLTAVAAACMGTTYAGGWEHDQEQLAQMAELHNLHATFHAAVSVHDPVNGDSAAVITQRIRDALSSLGGRCGAHCSEHHGYGGELCRQG